MTAEDHLAATIRPRLDAARADVSRVHAITAMPRTGDPDAPPTLAPDDVSRLEVAITEHRAELVVIDPLMAFLPGDIDAYRDQDVRRTLRPLAAVAERTGAAIIIVRHLRKGSGSALYRGGGSIGIVGAARSALMVAADPDDETARIIAPSKSNLAKLAPALRWRLVDAGDVARVEWLGTADGVTADDLAQVAPTRDDDADPRERAKEAILELLSDGKRLVKDVEADIKAMTGASQRTIERAREELRKCGRLDSVKEGRFWYLYLPAGEQHRQPRHDGGDGVLDAEHARNSPISREEFDAVNSATVISATPLGGHDDEGDL